jgi:hypothetical protein
MKKIFFILLLTLFLAPIKIYAKEASMFFSPGSGVYQTGKTITVKLTLNSRGEKINAAEAKIKFNPKFLKVKSITTEKSIFKLWTTKPAFSNKTGEISIGGGLPGSFKDTAGTIATIVFTASGKGRTTVDFKSAGALLANGSGQQTLKDKISAVYIIGSAKDVQAAAAMAKRNRGVFIKPKIKNAAIWYVNPADSKRYLIGTTSDFTNIANKLGKKVVKKYIADNLKKNFPKKDAGFILLAKDDKMKPYYINPVNKKAVDLSVSTTTMAILNKLALPISQDGFEKITDSAI